MRLPCLIKASFQKCMTAPEVKKLVTRAWAEYAMQTGKLVEKKAIFNPRKPMLQQSSRFERESAIPTERTMS
jgi:hypothetical protein